MTCAPIGPFPAYTPPDATCDCGAQLTPVAGDNEWRYVDTDGRTLVDTSPAGCAEDPRGWWDTLAAADIAAYSALSCRATLGMLGWTHGHRPARSAPYAGPVPYCCGEPMQAVPAGWRCRVRGTIAS